MPGLTSMPKRYRIILILLTVACGVCALVTMPIALLTAAWPFDGPGREHEVWPWIGFIAIVSIPFWFIIGAAAGWALNLDGWPRASLVVAATPLGAAMIFWVLLGCPATEFCQPQMRDSSEG